MLQKALEVIQFSTIFTARQLIPSSEPPSGLANRISAVKLQKRSFSPVIKVWYQHRKYPPSPPQPRTQDPQLHCHIITISLKTSVLQVGSTFSIRLLFMLISFILFLSSQSFHHDFNHPTLSYSCYESLHSKPHLVRKIKCEKNHQDHMFCLISTSAGDRSRERESGILLM